jgi:hypothetical protein
VPATLTVNNSEVNNNHANGDGGGIANGIPTPGPPPLFGGTVTLNHSQVSGNTAASGGGIFNFRGTVTLSMTSVTSNTPDNCAPPGQRPRLHRLRILPARTPAIFRSESNATGTANTRRSDRTHGSALHSAGYRCWPSPARK